MANLLVCSPGDVYRHMSRVEAEQAYTEMAIEGYDALVKFNDEYNPEIADVVAGGFWEKEGLPIDLTVFLDQPIVSVGGLSGEWNSTSYLLNPARTSPKEGFLPDLDAVVIEGPDSTEALARIQEFYQDHGWQTGLYDRQLSTFPVHLPGGRFVGQTKLIINPFELRRLAVEDLGYNLVDLAFKKSA